MYMDPHGRGSTLPVEAFVEPSHLVGFEMDHPNGAVFMHYHDFYELALVLDGTGIHMVSGGEQRVRRGSVIFIAPGASHGYRLSDGLAIYNCLLRVEAAQFELPWAHQDRWLGSLFTPPGAEPRPPAVVALDEEPLLECLSHLDAIRQCPTDHRSEAFDLGHLLLALDVVARNLDCGRSALSAGATRPTTLVERAMELMSQDLARRWTLDDLAGQLFVSPFHLSRQFNRCVGLPPIAWLGRSRADRAAVLLTTTDVAVGTIGSEVGWPDPSQFSRRFHQLMGVSPRTYRARSRRHTTNGTGPSGQPAPQTRTMVSSGRVAGPVD